MNRAEIEALVKNAVNAELAESGIKAMIEKAVNAELAKVWLDLADLKIKTTELAEFIYQSNVTITRTVRAVENNANALEKLTAHLGSIAGYVNELSQSTQMTVSSIAALQAKQ